MLLCFQPPEILLYVTVGKQAGVSPIAAARLPKIPAQTNRLVQVLEGPLSNLGVASTRHEVNQALFTIHGVSLLRGTDVGVADLLGSTTEAHLAEDLELSIVGIQ